MMFLAKSQNSANWTFTLKWTLKMKILLFHNDALITWNMPVSIRLYLFNIDIKQNMNLLRCYTHLQIFILWLTLVCFANICGIVDILSCRMVLVCFSTFIRSSCTVGRYHAVHNLFISVFWSYVLPNGLLLYILVEISVISNTSHAAQWTCTYLETACVAAKSWKPNMNTAVSVHYGDGTKELSIDRN